MVKLPPHGNRILKMQENGWHDDVYVFCGIYAWDFVNNFKFTSGMPGQLPVCLPPWTNPLEFKWPVNKLDVYIFDTGFSEDDYLNDLAYALSQYGAKTVWCVTPEYDIFQFEKD